VSAVSTMTPITPAHGKQQFTELLKASDPAMRAVAWRMLRNQPAMEDVLQESYIKAWRNFERFEGNADQFTAWLYRIVRNSCIDWFRANKKRRSNVALDERIDADAGNLPVADRIVNRSQIRQGLQALQPDQAAALALVDGEGYSFEQAAEILDVPRGTVASRVSRARATMRRELGFDGEAQS